MKVTVVGRSVDSISSLIGPHKGGQIEINQGADQILPADDWGPVKVPVAHSGKELIILIAVVLLKLDWFLFYDHLLWNRFVIIRNLDFHYKFGQFFLMCIALEEINQIVKN